MSIPFKQNDRKLILTAFSHARVGLGHTGGHCRYQDWLNFQKDFALAKDAVNSEWNTKNFIKLCNEMKIDTIVVHTKAADLKTFLVRPDWGRQLSENSQWDIENYLKLHSNALNRDILILISGGLSPAAVEQQISGFVSKLLLDTHKMNLSVAPIIITPRSRVALGDVINDYFQAKIVIVIIGERPGLTTTNSIGIYFTYDAKSGCTDAARNCISNIHQQGLSHTEATEKLLYLLKKALSEKRTGVCLKDDFNEMKVLHDLT